MWTKGLKETESNEMLKVRHRIASYLHGIGLDLGCGNEKVCEGAIGIDIMGKGADVKLDLTAIDSLGIFADGMFDYVFSSHVLEDFLATEAILDEWWRVIKPGGHLILYVPDPDYYPRVGTAGSNVQHKKDLYWQDVWKILQSFTERPKLIHHSRHNESNEFSWQLVVQKKAAQLKKVWASARKVFDGMSAFPRIKKRKEALVIRYGALGDAVMSTPVVRQLKKEGFYVVYNCSPYSILVLKENPNIDEFLVQAKDVIPNEELTEYWSDIGRNFDKVINLSETIEQGMLKVQGKPEFDWSHNKRRKLCNKNYVDYTMEVAGYPELKGEKTELFFTEQEERLARTFVENHKDRFIVVWAMSGSSMHKVYPWSEYVAGEIWKKHGNEVCIITVGDDSCRILEWTMPHTLPRCGMLTVRQSMLMTKYANLVIGPETGILNAAGCYDTPKIIFLSHSSEENLTKYWQNVTPLHPENCRCHPCHKLIYVDTCPSGKVGGRPRCAENIKPETVYKAFLKHFKEWKNEREIGQEQTRRITHKGRRRILNRHPGKKSIRHGRAACKAG